MQLRRVLPGLLLAATLGVPTGLSMGTPMSGASTPPPCSAAALAPSLGRGSAAAGTAYVTLIMKNRASGSCTLSGTPATQFGNFVASTGTYSLVIFRAVGPAATKFTLAGRGKTIVVRPGAVASVTIGIETAANYVPSQCHKANASRVRLVFSSRTRLYFTLATTEVCTKLASTTTSGVVSGTRYP